MTMSETRRSGFSPWTRWSASSPLLPCTTWYPCRSSARAIVLRWVRLSSITTIFAAMRSSPPAAERRLRDFVGDFFQRADDLGRAVQDRLARHAEHEGGRLVLDDGPAPPRADLLHARGAVAPHPGEQHAQHVGAANPRGRFHEPVHRRPVPRERRREREGEFLSRYDLQMVVVRREVNRSGRARLAVDGELDGERALAPEPLAKPRDEAGRDMLDDGDGRRQVRGQRF